MGVPVVESIIDVVARVLDRVLPDQQKKAEAMQRLMEMQQAGDLAVIAGQVEINKVEASNPRLFISGWRPFIGWVCGVGLATQFIVGPIFSWAASLAGNAIITFPTLPMEVLGTLLFGMLGLSGMRTYEKVYNAENRR